MTLLSDNVRMARPPARADEAEFEALFLEHWPRVYGVLFRLVGDPAEAEDLALETFWRLWQNATLATRHSPPAVGGWLYRVATNLGLNAIRSWKRRQRYELEAGVWDANESAPPEPSEAAAQADEQRRVRQALAKMNPRQSQLLILRHSGLSYREIAAALDVSPNSIGTLLARAEREFEGAYSSEG